MSSLKLKALCAACASVLAVSICPVFQASAVTNSFRSMGDADGNGKVSVEDAQTVLINYVTALSKRETISAETDPASDTNFDGIIDVVDASNILQYYCNTLAGNKPLWSDYRKVSSVTGQRGWKYDYEIVDYVIEDGITLPVVKEKLTEVFREYGKKGSFIEVGVASGKPGDYVSVPIYVSGMPLLAGFQLFIHEAGDAELTDIRCNINDIINSSIPSHDAIVNPDPNCGAMVWAEAQNAEIPDGSILGEYIYKIPEDAKPGSVYSLSLDRTESKFITAGWELSPEEYEAAMYDCNLTAYQYVVLDGAIAVEAPEEAAE